MSTAHLGALRECRTRRESCDVTWGQAACTLDDARATLSSVSRKVFLSLMDAAVRPYQFEPPAHIGTGIDWTNSSEDEGDNDQQVQQQQPNAECTWSVCSVFVYNVTVHVPCLTFKRVQFYAPSEQGLTFIWTEIGQMTWTIQIQ